MVSIVSSYITGFDKEKTECKQGDVLVMDHIFRKSLCIRSYLSWDHYRNGQCRRRPTSTPTAKCRCHRRRGYSGYPATVAVGIGPVRRGLLIRRGSARLRRGRSTPRLYTDGCPRRIIRQRQCSVRRGSKAVGVLLDSCSGLATPVFTWSLFDCALPQNKG
jgi:hypothetical protein